MGELTGKQSFPKRSGTWVEVTVERCVFVEWLKYLADWGI